MWERPSSPDAQPPNVIQTSPCRSWDDDWCHFRQDHPRWSAAADSSEPLYCLPGKALNVFRRSRGKMIPLFDDAAAVAETAFKALCRNHFGIGVWDGCLIQYYLLGGRPPSIPEYVSKVLGWHAGRLRLLNRD